MKVLAVDGNSIFYRAFYGVRLLSTKDGFFTNAIYGFLNILLKEIADVAPDYMAIAFDLPSPTFRHTRYDQYKAGRKPAPDELKMQMPVLQELLRLMGYAVVTSEGFEADDIIGTVAALTRKEGGQCVIVTGDRDSFQLVGGGITLHLAATRNGAPQVIVYDEKTIEEEYGIDDPERMIEIKALMGDTSDNIPGVVGIGPKTASSLICRYKTIDAIYENIDSIEVTDKVREQLKKSREQAFLSRELAAIRLDCPIDPDLNAYRIGPVDQEKTAQLLTKLEMNSILKKLELTPSSPSTASEKEALSDIEVRKVSGSELQALAKNKACALAVDWKDGQPVNFALSLDHTVLIPDPFTAEALSAVLSDNNIEKTVYNLKALHRFALSQGGTVANVNLSLDIAAYLLDPDSSDYNLHRLCEKYGFHPSEETARKAHNIGLLGGKMQALIESKGLLPLLRDIEQPLCEVLASMELYGIRLDAQELEKYGKVLVKTLSEIEQKIYREAGSTFNINSPKQLAGVLFDQLGLPVRRKTKSGYSTDSEVLESLKHHHPVPALIIEYRTVSKLVSTYVDSLIKLQAKDGRIHSTFLQTQTRTGRISSVDPNMQNIPVRSELGGELRKFFIPDPGCAFVDADYSQIELRILAHMADDEAMREAFRSGIDIHFKTAGEIFHQPPELVTPLMRSRAKAVNFGIVYGMGAFSLSKDTGVSLQEAAGYIEDYFATYKSVKRFLNKTVEDAKKTGSVSTLFGRIRPIPEILSSNKVQAAVGERMAKNTPIQGTAADIIKIAMVKVYRRLHKEQLQSRLILQVHDELIIEAPLHEVQRASLILKEEMEGAVSMTVPVIAEVHSGDSWYAAK